MSRYKVSIGEDFPVEAVDIVSEKDLKSLLAERTKRDMARARNWLAFLVFVVMTAALAGAAVIGLFEGNFEDLHAVYDRVTVPIGMVLGYYFTRKD